MTEQPGVIITLSEIYKKVEDTDSKLDALTVAVEQMVAVNRRLDQHHERLNAHGERLRKAESQVAAQWIVVGAVVAIAVAAIGRIIFGG